MSGPRIVVTAASVRSAGGVALIAPLLRSILRVRPSAEVTLFAHPDVAADFSSGCSVDARVTVLPLQHVGLVARAIWEQVHLPKFIKRTRTSVLLSLGNTGPLFPGCPQVLYVQQSLPFSDFRPSHHRIRWWFFKYVYLVMIGVAQLGSARVVVFTSWMVSAMRRSVGWFKPRAAYVVSPPGAPDELASELSLLPDKERDLIAKLQRWRDDGEVVLAYPCFMAYYKHIPYLAAAIHHLEERQPHPYRVVLTFDEESVAYFQGKDRILESLRGVPPERLIKVGTLTTAGMQEVYRAIDIVIFPSLVEALGLPLLEAMARGIPIVAADDPSPGARQAAFAREICQNAAVYAAPQDPRSFADHLFDLIAGYEKRMELGRAGISRIKRFSWDDHARLVLNGLVEDGRG